MLYAAIWRAAKAMGYRRCITYTQGDETGSSIAAAGFVEVKYLAPRKSWADSTVSFAIMRDPIGTGDVARRLWSISR